MHHIHVYKPSVDLELTSEMSSLELIDIQESLALMINHNGLINVSVEDLDIFAARPCQSYIGYSEKNVEDAYNWMNITESALSSMSSLLTNMYGYMNQGANDTYETLERETIVNQLDEYRQELYSLLNADNAGRHSSQS